MIFAQLTTQLMALHHLLTQLSDAQFLHKNIYLGNASIGGHTRHIIELFGCVINGYQAGKTDYFNRQRNMRLENDRNIAIAALLNLAATVNQPDKPMQLALENDCGAATEHVHTTYYREMVYNMEHTIHHLALIRVALREMKLELVSDDFGIAYSTLAYQSQNLRPAEMSI